MYPVMLWVVGEVFLAEYVGPSAVLFWCFLRHHSWFMAMPILMCVSVRPRASSAVT